MCDSASGDPVRLTESAVYLCSEDLVSHLVWTNCECVTRPQVTRCGRLNVRNRESAFCFCSEDLYLTCCETVTHSSSGDPVRLTQSAFYLCSEDLCLIWCETESHTRPQVTRCGWLNRLSTSVLRNCVSPGVKQSYIRPQVTRCG